MLIRNAATIELGCAPRQAVLSTARTVSDAAKARHRLHELRRRARLAVGRGAHWRPAMTGGSIQCASIGLLTPLDLAFSHRAGREVSKC